MAFLKNSYGELWVLFHAQAKCCMCHKLGEPTSFDSLEKAVAHLEMNNVCTECIFNDEKENKHGKEGKSKRS